MKRLFGLIFLYTFFSLQAAELEPLSDGSYWIGTNLWRSIEAEGEAWRSPQNTFLENRVFSVEQETFTSQTKIAYLEEHVGHVYSRLDYVEQSLLASIFHRLHCLEARQSHLEKEVFDGFNDLVLRQNHLNQMLLSVQFKLEQLHDPIKEEIIRLSLEVENLKSKK
jgi:hypothetical protein